MRRAALLSFCALATACDGKPPAGPAQEEESADPLQGFDCTFEDATQRSGVAFVHETGGTGAKLLPETMGSGAALFDRDGDGALDLYLVNSGALPGSSAGAEARSALYDGRGDGTFQDVSRGSGADLARYGMGCAAADFDADGDQDLYVTALGENALLVNDGVHLRDEAAQAGVTGGRWTDAGGAQHASWSTAAVWLDAEVDGDLDLFVGAYCQWTPELEIFTSLDGVRKTFSTPDRYVGLPSRLYKNRGDGTFEDTPAEELGAVPGKALGAAAYDLDQDGRDELIVAHDTRPNALFLNRGGGRFEEAAERAGIAYDANGRARAGMGIDVEDLDADGQPFLAIGNFAGEPLSIYRFDGQRFVDWSRRSGLEEASFAPLTFGLLFLDADLDGRLDLCVANGHIEPEIELFRPAERHAQPAQLFRGLGAGSFADASRAAGAGLAAPRVGRGLAAGDVDGDGDLDLVLTQNGGPAALLLNRAEETRPRHFLRVALRGRGGNRDALGAVITLESGGRRQRRTVHTGSSYLSQGELTATFGLGQHAGVELLEVRWPGGPTLSYPVPEVDRTLVLDAP